MNGKFAFALLVAVLAVWATHEPKVESWGVRSIRIPRIRIPRIRIPPVRIPRIRIPRIRIPPIRIPRIPIRIPRIPIRIPRLPIRIPRLPIRIPRFPIRWPPRLPVRRFPWKKSLNNRYADVEKREFDVNNGYDDVENREFDVNNGYDDVEKREFDVNNGYEDVERRDFEEQMMEKRQDDDDTPPAFADVDTNGSGQIEYDEVIALLQSGDEDATLEDIMATLSALDPPFNDDDTLENQQQLEDLITALEQDSQGDDGGQ